MTDPCKKLKSRAISAHEAAQCCIRTHIRSTQIIEGGFEAIKNLPITPGQGSLSFAPEGVAFVGPPVFTVPNIGTWFIRTAPISIPAYIALGGIAALSSAVTRASALAAANGAIRAALDAVEDGCCGCVRSKMWGQDNPQATIVARIRRRVGSIA